jgi:hypothetical protein
MASYSSYRQSQIKCACCNWRYADVIATAGRKSDPYCNTCKKSHSNSDAFPCETLQITGYKQHPVNPVPSTILVWSYEECQICQCCQYNYKLDSLVTMQYECGRHDHYKQYCLNCVQKHFHCEVDSAHAKQPSLFDVLKKTENDDYNPDPVTPMLY